MNSAVARIAAMNRENVLYVVAARLDPLFPKAFEVLPGIVAILKRMAIRHCEKNPNERKADCSARIVAEQVSYGGDD
jgi:hypothetical protein